MRIAFAIHTHNATSTVLDLFPASELSEFPNMDPVRLNWTNDKSKMDGLVATSLDARHVMKSVDAALEAANWTRPTTPFATVRALLACGATQVVWDPTAKKYRNLSTAKDGSDTWELVGVKGLTVDADDEEGAVRSAKRTVTTLMQEKPERAVELVAFFTNECKVKKVQSGKIPEAIKPEALACTDDERKEATKPIVVKPTARELRKERKAKGESK